ncbi:MAG: LodA/GoxA family CTQ-dependent oxidase [Pyrinomonadaceae bacterium]
MRFKIHPAIGIARVGDSPDEFYLAPEQAGQIPNELNSDGTERPVTKFKDAAGRVKRQAARFRVYGYDDDFKQGNELQVGEQITTVYWKTGQTIVAEVKDIQWSVYLANKKASWYEFQQLDGEHGYSSDHPLRNKEVTNPDARQQLIIDPGPQTVSYSNKKQRTANFARGQNPGYTQSFPPPLTPNSVDTLGEMRAIQQGQNLRLLVLGGHGNSGSYKKGFGHPVIHHYANNDGWFDDVSDGPVTASVVYKIISVNGRTDDPTVGSTRSADVDVPAWCVVGYPRYAPTIVDIVTMDEIAYDVAVRHFGYDPYMYGTPPYTGQKPPDPADAKALDLWRKNAQWNPDYYPYFYRDIWPILTRPQSYQFVFDFDTFAGGDPHDTTSGVEGNFDPSLLSVPPYEGEDPDERAKRQTWRRRIWWALRKPGQENLYNFPPDPSMPNYFLVLMPFLCGDNPLTNTVPSKFLRLTNTQLFILGQWAAGKFINEQQEDIPTTPPEQRTLTGTDLDRGVLSNGLGGAFCPGGEVAWIIRNPAIYAEPFRIKHSTYFSPKVLASWQPNPLSLPGPLTTPQDQGSLAVGLEPGDLTKYGAVPWQADFNECSTQPTDITYAQWNVIEPQSVGDPAPDVPQTTYWWPSHRPMEVLTAQGGQVPWSQGIPQTNAGDLKMVTAWKDLGFIGPNPDYTPTNGNPQFIQVERNDDNI